VTLVTYRDGRPVGLQPVNITTGGDVVPSDYLPLSSPGAIDREPTAAPG
jgi:hypothetical protein